MKKYVLILVGSIILELLIGCFLFNNKDNFSVFPTENKLTFNGLSSAVCDSHDKLYTIDNSRKRITKIDSNGKVQYIIQNKNSLEATVDMAIDENENLYVMNTILDSGGHFVDGEEIVKYTSDGKLSKVIYKIEYEKGKKPIRTGYLKTLKIKDKKLYFYNIKENAIKLNSISLDDYSCNLVYDINIDYAPYIYNITGLETGKIFYSTKKGEIYKIGLENKPKLIYSSKDIEKTEKSVPVFVNYDNSNFLYFLDISSDQVKRLEVENTLPPEKYFTMKEVIKDNYGITQGDVQDLRIRENSKILIAVEDHVVKLSNDKKIYAVIDGAEYSYSIYYFRWLVWSLAFLQVILLVFIIFFTYSKIMERRTTILLKQVVVFVPIIIFSLALVSVIVSKEFTERHEVEIQNKLKLLVHIGSKSIDAANIEKIKEPSDFMGDYYKILRQQLHSLFEGKPNIEVGSDNAYAAVYKYENGQVYTCAYYDDSMIPYCPYSDPDYLKVAKSGEILVTKTTDAAGEWMYAIGPIYDNNGKVVGVFETGSDMNELNQHKKNLFIKITKIIALIIVVIIMIFLIMTYYLLRSIRELKGAVDEIASGKLDTVVEVTSRDEGAELCKGFNIMSKYVNDYIVQITELSESYYRFVPQQYLSMLGKNSILDVKLGDQVKCEMSVLILNIRRFFILSEAMTPEENFQFINLFLKEISPCIIDNDGFVDDYTGAGIVALFPSSAEDAVKTAIETIEKLESLNKSLNRSGKEKLEIGIGIHKGPLMLGIIGDERRMEGTVISDSVNLTATLEDLTLKLDVATLVTKGVIKDLQGKNVYEYRNVGLLRLEGKEGLVDIYDLYQSDLKDVREAKNKTKESFEEGITLYQQGDFYDARNKFLEVIKKNDKDKVAKIYFFLCDEYHKNGTNELWQGEISI